MPSQTTLLALAVVLIACCVIPLRTLQPSSTKHNYGEWALVAGASEGLGEAWAKRLCQNGLNVLLVARRERMMHELAVDLMEEYPSCTVDVLVQDLAAATTEIDKLFAQVFTLRPFGVLVYNAAHVGKGYFVETSLATQQTTLAVNVQGVMTLTHLFTQQLVKDKRPGGVILMSSIAGVVGNGYYANYAATKSYITSLATGLYWEMQSQGVDILACVAGATNTTNYRQQTKRTSPWVMVQEPEDVTAECWAALGKLPSIATGPANKLGRFLLSRLLSPSMAIDFISRQALQLINVAVRE